MRTSLLNRWRGRLLGTSVPEDSPEKAWRYGKEPRVSTGPRFELSFEVAQRFNAYATAALPYEIGGMLRVQQQENGSWLATDLRVFRQAVSPIYFELDGTATAQFNMDLFRDGKKEELPEWRALIHSHPSMTPFMSGPDRENLERLAGQRFAFSVICAASSEPATNYFAVHYAQGVPLPLVVHDLPVLGEQLSGITTLSDSELAAIELEVAELCSSIDGTGRRPRPRDLAAVRDNEVLIRPTSQSASAVSASPRPTWGAYGGGRESFKDGTDTGPEVGFATALLSDEEYELIDAAVGFALEGDPAGDALRLEDAFECVNAGTPITDHAQLQAFHGAVISYREHIQAGGDGESQRAAVALLEELDYELQNYLDDGESDRTASSISVHVPYVSVARRALCLYLEDLDGAQAPTELIDAYAMLMSGAAVVDEPAAALLRQAVEERVGTLIADGGHHGAELDQLDEVLAALAFPPQSC